MVLEKVLKTTKYIADKSRDVKINEEGLEKITKEIPKQSLPDWSNKYYFFGPPAEIAQYFFILDCLNFCFFAEKGRHRWGVELNNEKVTGFFAMALALKKSAEKGLLLDATFLSEITRQDAKEILKGADAEVIPLFSQRWQILRETGRILLKKFSGQAENILKKANGSAENLAAILIKEFPSFRDIAYFQGQKIYFLKRAQIFAGDIYGVFRGQGLGEFSDIDKLTCFADYKIPQILNHFGVIQYSPKLLEKIRSEKMIRRFSRQELEIRANTVQAVEKIKKELKKNNIILSSFQIDWILWNMAKSMTISLPHHKTRTIYYWILPNIYA